MRNKHWVLVLLIVWLATAWWAHREFLPYDVNNTDTATWLFQAQTFADGKIWRSTPEPREFFQQWQVVVRDRSYNYYPPGHALLLAIPLKLGWDPWLVPWFLSGACLFLMYLVGSRWIRPEAALFSATALAFSPFFAANVPSLLSHSTALFLTLLFLGTVMRWRETGRPFFALGCGLVLSAIFATRSANAAALGIVWIPWVFWVRKSETRKEICSWLLFVIGGILLLLPFLFYYHSLAGRWTLDLFTDYWPRNQFGFGKNLGRGEPGHFFQTWTDHNWAKWWLIIQYSLQGLAEWWSGYTWFSLVLFLFPLGWVLRNGKLRASNFGLQILFPWVAWPLVHIALHAFYFTPSTPFSGPRYLTEIIPALAIATGWTVWRLYQTTDVRWVSVLLIGVFIATSSWKKTDFYTRNAEGVHDRQLVQECVERQTKYPALVLIRSFWIGHPFPIFLNRPGFSDPVLFACDRGEEDQKLIARFPERNAYILAVAPPSQGRPAQARLIPIYDASTQRWLKEPETVSAPFFIGGGFTPPIELRGDIARQLFYPKPEEIQNQHVERAFP